MFDSGISAKDLIEQVKSEVDVALPISNATYVTWLNSLEHFLYSSIIREQNKITAPAPYTGVVNLASLPITSDEASIRFDDIYTVYADSTQLIKTNVASGQIFSNCYYKHNGDMAYSIAKTPDKLNIVYYVKPAPKVADANDEILNNAYDVFNLTGDENTVYSGVFQYNEGDTLIITNKTGTDINCIYFDEDDRFDFAQPIPAGKSALCEVTKSLSAQMEHVGKEWVRTSIPGKITPTSFIDVNYGHNVMVPIEFIELVKSKLRAEAYMIENEYTPAANWMNNYNVLLENFKQWLNERAAQFGM